MRAVTEILQSHGDLMVLYFLVGFTFSFPTAAITLFLNFDLGLETDLASISAFYGAEYTATWFKALYGAVSDWLPLGPLDRRRPYLVVMSLGTALLYLGVANFVHSLGALYPMGVGIAVCFSFNEAVLNGVAVERHHRQRKETENEERRLRGVEREDDGLAGRGQVLTEMGHDAAERTHSGRAMTVRDEERERTWTVKVQSRSGAPEGSPAGEEGRNTDKRVWEEGLANQGDERSVEPSAGMKDEGATASSIQSCAYLVQTTATVASGLCSLGALAIWGEKEGGTDKGKGARLILAINGCLAFFAAFFAIRLRPLPPDRIGANSSSQEETTAEGRQSSVREAIPLDCSSAEAARMGERERADEDEERGLSRMSSPTPPHVTPNSDSDAGGALLLQQREESMGGRRSVKEGSCGQKLRRLGLSVWAALKLLTVPGLFLFCSSAMPISSVAFSSFVLGEKGLNLPGWFAAAVPLLSSAGGWTGTVLFWAASLRSRGFWESGRGWATAVVLGTLLSVGAGLTTVVAALKIHRQWGIGDTLFVVGDSFFVGLANAFAFVPLLVLAAKVSPKKSEATSFASLFSINAAAGSVSAWATSALSASLHVSADNGYSSLWLLILVCNAAKLLPLVLVPFAASVIDSAVVASPKKQQNPVETQRNGSMGSQAGVYQKNIKRFIN
uniref:Uncharacterized protein n=1 Tax=Chromera velia CCMP2878 TaxID=1169474 RepID=A0A0G4HL60_9ALVE|mmetsp:Transcript_8159/g.15921  ORF Transcript_8159/g.15921 Transcript_8159/m.15921 type:complete len:674 (-) Transcript_8159:8-2029(-)|eukprot:Cvel_7307.t1-p1 / transcript=Cvel_7307.t1 / gene=Cvel_7307 / organism=Chromera_velia_CCMP2878 / gene_product=Folate-biopterin transporter 1, chloroplastic, putative / transcript_product=Folate-biopterin transporter 1, chloroplastic, putative / location=Cvel_scaffold378:51493-55361(+) / protein_length=673 / sequence_SO=supercontig / SO=protein_coding / is_pseudo=false